MAQIVAYRDNPEEIIFNGTNVIVHQIKWLPDASSDYLVLVTGAIGGKATANNPEIDLFLSSSGGITPYQTQFDTTNTLEYFPICGGFIVTSGASPSADIVTMLGTV